MQKKTLRTKVKSKQMESCKPLLKENGNFTVIFICVIMYIKDSKKKCPKKHKTFHHSSDERNQHNL